MPEVGDPAPDFTLPDQSGETVTLSGLRGKTVVLFFYPRADTPGCTIEACGFRDAKSDFDAAEVVVLGISPDGVKDQQKFAHKFTFLSVILYFPVNAPLMRLSSASARAQQLPSAFGGLSLPWANGQ